MPVSAKRILGVLATVVIGACLVVGVSASTSFAFVAQAPRSQVVTLTTADPIATWVDLRMSSMSVEDKVRSLFIHHVAGQSPDAMRELVSPHAAGGYGAGGIILMRDNVWPTSDQVAAQMAIATAEPDLPPIVAIDEEGGEVQRLAFDAFYGADQLRFLPSPETTAAFSGRGDLLASIGVNVNFGIVADVTADSQSFIFGRTLGSDPAAAAERVRAAVSGESGRVASTLKHFPGHGRTGADSHVGIPSTDAAYADWSASDAVPFQAGIDAGATFVMFGHLVYSAVDDVPASLSPEWHRILRDDMGFDGITITDDLRMLQDSGDPAYTDPYANAVHAVQAGNDALLYVLPADPSTVGIDRERLVQVIVAAVESGDISEERLDDATRRLLTFRRSLAPGASTWVPPCDAQCILNTVLAT